VRPRLAAIVAFALAAAPATAAAAEVEVASGGIRAVVTDRPWSVTYRQPGGEDLREVGGLGFRDASGAWHRAAAARSLRRDRDGVVAEVAMDGGRAGRLVAPRPGSRG
jgi:hypothetical protein